MEFQALRPDDWPAVRAIYQAGIATGDATFETAAPDWPAWDAAHLADHRLVARHDGRVVGWTALAPVSDRCAYAGVAEDSIYVAPDAQGRGIGRRLLTAVVASAEQGGIWTVQTGIFPENQASVRLSRPGLRLPGGRGARAPGSAAWPLARRAAAGASQPSDHLTTTRSLIAVLDASGTWTQLNPLGASGLPALSASPMPAPGSSMGCPTSVAATVTGQSLAAEGQISQS